MVLSTIFGVYVFGMSFYITSNIKISDFMGYLTLSGQMANNRSRVICPYLYGQIANIYPQTSYLDWSLAICSYLDV